MGKYFITGAAGSGKSTTIQALQERGFSAYDTDDLPEVTRLQDRQTGEFVDWPAGPADFSKNAWNWQADGLKKLLASDKTVFVGASVANQQQFYGLFDKIFALVIDSESLRHRLLTRTNNDAGKHPEDLRYFLKTHARVERDLLHAGAIAIDSTQPLQTVVDEILSHCHDENS